MYPDIFVLHVLSLLDAQRGLRVLDAGCGAGRNSIFLAQEGCRVMALDRSLQMLTRGKAHGREAGTEVGFLLGRVEALPLRDASFDLLVCTSVLEQMTVAIVRKAARDFWRVLRPGGHLLVVTVAQEGSEPDYAVQDPYDPNAPFKARLTTKGDLETWFSGFKVLELLHLRLEAPASAPVRAQWAMVARRLEG